jgi:release factor glutamine methyltransferase
MPLTIADACARRDLPRREIEMLLEHVLALTRASVIAHPERVFDHTQVTAFERLYAERLRGVPMAYLLGHREFYGRTFMVTPDVLIPRPETETLITQALESFSSINDLEMSADKGLSSPTPSENRRKRAEFAPRSGPLPSAKQAPEARNLAAQQVSPIRVLDLGTGSGAIAITLALELPSTRVTATDISPGALAVAKQNAARLGADVTLLESNWFVNIGDARFHMIVSNPPYVAHGDPHLARGDLRFEPSIALTDGTPDARGLRCIHHIITTAPAHLLEGGWLMFEHGYDQAGDARAALQARGFRDVFSAEDLAGIPRISGGRWFT